MTEYCKSGPWICPLIAGVHRLGGGLPEMGLHAGWFFPVEEQKG